MGKPTKHQRFPPYNRGRRTAGSRPELMRVQSGEIKRIRYLTGQTVRQMAGLLEVNESTLIEWESERHGCWLDDQRLGLLQAMARFPDLFVGSNR